MVWPGIPWKRLVRAIPLVAAAAIVLIWAQPATTPGVAGRAGHTRPAPATPSPSPAVPRGMAVIAGGIEGCGRGIVVPAGQSQGRVEMPRLAGTVDVFVGTGTGGALPAGTRAVPPVHVADGETFRVVLPPGTYTLVGHGREIPSAEYINGKRVYPGPTGLAYPPQTVTLVAGQVKDVSFSSQACLSASV